MNDSKVKGLIPVLILSALAVICSIYHFVQMIRDLSSFKALPYTVYMLNTLILTVFVPALIMFLLPLLHKKLGVRIIILSLFASSITGCIVTLCGNIYLLRSISYYTTYDHYMKVWFFILNYILERAFLIALICLSAVLTLLKKRFGRYADIAVYGFYTVFALHDMISYMVSYGSSFSSANNEFVTLFIFAALIVYIVMNYCPEKLFPEQALDALKKRYEKGKISEEKYNAEVRRINGLHG